MTKQAKVICPVCNNTWEVPVEAAHAEHHCDACGYLIPETWEPPQAWEPNDS